METQNHSRPADAPSPNTAFRLLSDRRRRYAVAVLSERAEPISLAELAERIAAWEAESDADDTRARRPDSVAVALHHTHLPKLADAGVVAYDADAETVFPADTEPLEPLLAAPDGVAGPSE